MATYPDNTATPQLPVRVSERPGQLSSTRPPVRAGAVWAALWLVYLIWGSTYLGIKVVAESLPPFGSAATRFGAAAVLLAATIAAVRGVRALRVTGRQLAASALVGVLLLAGGNGLVVLAESPRFGLPSGLAALLISLSPVTMVVLRGLAGDRPRPATIAGVLIGFAGLAAMFLPGLGGDNEHPFPVAGGALVLLAVLCWCGGSFATRWLPMPANPFVASVYEMAAGGLALVLVAVLTREPAIWTVSGAPAKAWLTLAYLIVFGSLVAYTAYVWLLQRAPLSLTMTYGYVNPIIALMLGAVLAGEVLTAPVLAASAVVLLGVVLVVSTERPRTASA